MRRILLSLLALAAAAPLAFAQSRTPLPSRVNVFSTDNADPDRAMLGVSTSSDGKRDTLGLLVTAVTENSPAEKAGIEEGNRIASINGANLKLARGDAGESDMSGVMSNRLSREMRKLKPGDEATLDVWAGGRYRTVKVKTVSAEELLPSRRTRESDDERAALGLSISSSGSKRDTLGVFVQRVTEDGPAEKAGINEGDRIASINGVDLRTAKDDIEEGWSSGNRVQRLQREIGKLKPGQTADLVVVSGGRSRNVKVTAARARDLKEHGGGYSFHMGDGVGMINLDGLRQSLRRIGPEIQMQLNDEIPRAMDEVRRSMERVRIELPRTMQRLRIEAPALRTRVIRGIII